MKASILDLGLALLLIAAALVVRLLYAQAVVFPPLDDPAFHLVAARNLVTGQGLVVDVLWSYNLPQLAIPHPSHEHWMPLPTFLVAAALAVQRLASLAPDLSLRLAQLPGLLLGCLLVPLTYAWGLYALPEGRRNRPIALAAALLVAVNATLGYQSASVDSSAPFALFAAWALTAMIRRPGEPISYFGTGLLIALAYLARSDGLLLLLALPLARWLLPAPPRLSPEPPDNPVARQLVQQVAHDRATTREWRRATRPRLAELMDLLVAFALLVVPWLVRNYLAFGTPFPASVLDQAWLTDYADTFNYHSPASPATWLAQGWPTILAQRGEALLDSVRVFLLSTFPWGLLALPGFWLLRRQESAYPPLVYGLLLFIGLCLVFPISAMSGTIYHSQGAVLPFVALAAAYALYRGVRRLARPPRRPLPLLAILLAAILFLSAAQVAIALPAVRARHQAEEDQFQAAAAWLEQNAAPGDVVMTTQSYTLHYVSGHPTIALPANESPDAAWDAAQRFGARWLIVTQSFGLYPQVLHDGPDPRFSLVASNDTTEFYEILPSNPGE